MQFDLIGQVQVQAEILAMRADPANAKMFADWFSASQSYPDVFSAIIGMSGMMEPAETLQDEGMRRLGLQVAQMIAAAEIDPAKCLDLLSEMEGTNADTTNAPMGK